MKTQVLAKAVISAAAGRSGLVALEWAGPGVGGGIVFPLSVSVSLALELLLSDVLVGVSGGGGLFLLKGGGVGGSDGNKNGDD